MKYATFSAGTNGIAGALVKMDEVKPGVGGTLVYFDSEEITDELSRVEVEGGKILRPKLNIGELRFIALVEDLKEI